MAGMFSDAFAGLEGLEVEELEELKTAVEDLGKQHKYSDIRMGERKKKALKKKERALGRMKECIDEWLSRPFAPQTTPPRIMSRNDRPLLEDQAARRALRRLYHHVISHENPLITAGGAGWTEQLGVLVDDLCENLAKTAIVDSSTSPLWVPEELTQPLKDWKTVVVPKFSPPPEPWELPSEPEPEVHKKDFNKSVDLQSEWRCYKLSSEYTPESIAADIFNGVRNTSDPDATKMPLHTPPSYHSQQIPPLRLQQHTEEAARIQGPV